MAKVKLRRHVFSAEFGRFIAAGALNTVITLAVFYCLLLTTPYGLAYAVSWVIGLAFIATVYPQHVFRTAGHIASRVLIVAIYLMVFGIGLITLKALAVIGIPPTVAILLVLFLTSIVNYVVMRLLVPEIGKIHSGPTPNCPNPGRTPIH